MAAPFLGRPTRVRYLVLAAGCSMALLAYIHRLGFSIFAPDIKKDFSLNDQDMGNLMFAFLVSYGACQIPGGLAGDRFGARLLLPVFVVGWSLATAAIALVPAGTMWAFSPLILLLVLRTLFGAFQSGAFPVFARVIADWMPMTERASAQGAMWTASRLGVAILPFLLVWSLHFFGGWRLPLGIAAGLGLLWAIPFWTWFRNRPEEVPRVNAAERALLRADQAPVTGQPLAVPWRRMLRSRSVWCLCLMYGSCGPAGNFVLTLLPLYLSDHRHLPDDTRSWLLGLPLAVGFFACSLGGLASDQLIRRTGSRRWGRSVNGVLGLTLAGLAFAGTVGTKDVWLLGLLLCAVQFGNDFCMGPAWAACADIGERYAGTLSGLMNMTSNFTGAVAAVVAGYWLRHGQAQWVFLVFGGIWIFGALCWLGIDVTRPLAPSPDSGVRGQESADP